MVLYSVSRLTEMCGPLKISGSPPDLLFKLKKVGHYDIIWVKNLRRLPLILHLILHACNL